MKVLILNQYYPPDTSSTAEILELIAERISNRHEVTVIAGRPSYAPTETHPYYLLRSETVDMVRVDRVGSTSFQRAVMMGRLINTFLYIFLTLIRAMFMRPKPDVVIAMSDPPLVALVGVFVSMARRCEFIYNIRDLHPDMAVASGMVNPGLFIRLWEKIHRWVMRRASLVVVLGEDMRARIVAKGIAPTKVSVNRTSAVVHPELESSDLTPENTEDDLVRREIREAYEFVVVHAGNLGYAGNWENLVAAISVVDSSKVRLVFIGTGAHLKQLEEQSTDMQNIKFLPYFSRDAVPRVLRAADLHVVAVKRGLEGLVVPSKLYPILMAGRPVLAMSTSGSDVAKIVTEYDCGFVADPDDPEDIAAKIMRAMANPGALDGMGVSARKAGMEFSQNREMDRFVDLIEITAKSRQSRSMS